ncbi:sulfatase family protein [Paenibacillus sp. strain BS8-2]
MTASNKRPNIVFIMSDDHAAHAISSYGSLINETPNIDRIAKEGMRFDNCFCTNSICSPSRAATLTGTYNHINGIKTIFDEFDGRQQTLPKLLQADGYQTSIIGKWHLGHGGMSDPTGFDYWNILPHQGEYIDPDMIEMGVQKKYKGYVTDLITDMSIKWIDNCDKDRPFMLMCHHKAPHRSWVPDEKHAHMYEDVDIPEPPTFHDTYDNRAEAAAAALMRVDRDLNDRDLKQKPPEGLSDSELKSWKYQRYMKDYLRCVASIDDNVGRLLDYLEEQGLAEHTIVVYTSDQGFFLGDHGWYDKRFMYEESLRMPFLIRYPELIKPGTAADRIAVNVDFAPTFLELAGLPIPADMQGASFVPLLRGENPEGWRRSMYYRYWEHMSPPHRVYSHYGLRTERYKLIYYYSESLGSTGALDDPKEKEWELFDLEVDPAEMRSVYAEPEYAAIVKQLKEELYALKLELKDYE